MNRRSAVRAIAASIVGLGASAGLSRSAPHESDGVVSIKSAYRFDETIERIKADISLKKIMFFDVIDQAKLASGAGIELRPSTLLVFGNPPLGAQFLTSNPAAGLDWPVRLLVTEDAQGGVRFVPAISRNVSYGRLRRPSRPPEDRRRAGLP